MKSAAHDVAQTDIETDVVIIGGGACGLAFANRLKRDAVVIESGGQQPDPTRDQSYMIDSLGEVMNEQSLQRRLLGGSGALWSARCAALDAVDFTIRRELPHSGWPITAQDLQPYYEHVAADWRLPTDAIARARAERALQRAVASVTGVTLQTWGYAFERAETPLNIGRHYLPLFNQPGKRLLLQAEVTGFECDGGRVVAISVADRNGRTMRVQGRHFVLTAGCVENNRLLLQDRASGSPLLAGAGSWLGRGFHQHLAVNSGTVMPSGGSDLRLQQLFNRRRRRPAVSYETGVRLADDCLTGEGLPNAAAKFLYFPTVHAPLTGLPRLVTALARGHEPVFPRPRVLVEIMAEQQIDPDSAITLGPPDDAGRRRAQVNWKINDAERRSVMRLTNLLSDMLALNGLGTLDHVASPDQVKQMRMRDSLHHMGGTRMADDPANGVVDRHLRVHGTHNLTVIGGSVFPTGGHANPTMTMAALALRAADHLDRNAR